MSKARLERLSAEDVSNLRVEDRGLPMLVAVLWFSCLVGMLRFRLTQNYVNVQFLLYSFCLLLIGISGFVWLAGGHHAANSFAFHASSRTGWGQWTFFSTVVLALLGIEVPLISTGTVTGTTPSAPRHTSTSAPSRIRPASPARTWPGYAIRRRRACRPSSGMP